jgi:hypothetical protein
VTVKRSFLAVHVVALAIWLGSLVFSFLLAKTLFDAIKPVCPACLVTTEKLDTLACATCGARHHASCAKAGCGLEHEGSHDLVAAPAVAVVATTSLGHWERVRSKDDHASPERRLLWRLDGTSNALDPEKGEVPGACFELPRPGVGDALARAFLLSAALGIAMGIAALLTVLFTPPGGMLRLFRIVALASAFAGALYGLSAANTIATLRLTRESTTVATEAQKKEFGIAHAFSSVAGISEAALVLVGLVLALERRDEKKPTPTS